jgi:hypothetical protein
MADRDPPNWQPVLKTLIVFRFVKEDSLGSPHLADSFLSDSACKKKLLPDEHPDIQRGMSVFDSLEHARSAWAEIYEMVASRASSRNKRRKRPVRINVGHFVAEVELKPGADFQIVGPPDERGHLTIQGNEQELAEATIRIYPANMDDPYTVVEEV